MFINFNRMKAHCVVTYILILLLVYMNEIARNAIYQHYFNILTLSKNRENIYRIMFGK